MKKYIKKFSATGLTLTFAASSLVGLSAPTFATASSVNEPSRYIAPLHPLNRSGVTGMANLSLDSRQPGASLEASINARGTEPNQIHAVHIHGKLDAEVAKCPTNRADTNSDGIVSVFEGAPDYGPIKVSFTDPITPFGPPANTTLFAPFAGAPVLNNFPKSDSAGKVNYNMIIPFDQGNQYAVQALASLTPLEDQHIVIHGGFAPESVDTMGGDPNKTVYDPLLPVACGSIVQTHKGSNASHNGNSGHNDDHNNGNAGHGGGQGISNTGPGSTNQVSHTNNSSATVNNNNRVDVNSRTTQNSRSGDAMVSRNTSGGSATSGSANNNSSNSFIIRLMNYGMHLMNR